MSYLYLIRYTVYLYSLHIQYNIQSHTLPTCLFKDPPSDKANKSPDNLQWSDEMINDLLSDKHIHHAKKPI